MFNDRTAYIGNMQNPSRLVQINFSKNDPYLNLLDRFFQQPHGSETRKVDGNELYYRLRPISEILTCLDLMGST